MEQRFDSSSLKHEGDQLKQEQPPPQTIPTSGLTDQPGDSKSSNNNNHSDKDDDVGSGRDTKSSVKEEEAIKVETTTTTSGEQGNDPGETTKTKATTTTKSSSGSTTDSKDFPLKSNPATLMDNLDSIPEIPEIPELKFDDDNSQDAKRPRKGPECGQNQEDGQMQGFGMSMAGEGDFMANQMGK